MEPLTKLYCLLVALGTLGTVYLIIGFYRANDWRDMETAPKDGTVIVGQIMGESYKIRWCEDDYWAFVDRDSPTWADPEAWHPMPTD